ncbi:TonB-linked SusC/RagA family outer membrane protein [Marinilabilia salmonicolor]|uniref:TonB-linked SusC/RagA family outer membrane protein n=2 Tax=Marinilabilia salmonicolor TaxID=989 RepID=A0A2T0XEN5_9BACT|nr:TonB-linked SusC/RagA family outer membrane protein [Marinilabilia salmonicolor]RCW36839.1 TonB-linked SusC/RagA family outer membrane protein [Marinilabilia salmonicolor]
MEKNQFNPLFLTKKRRLKSSKVMRLIFLFLVANLFVVNASQGFSQPAKLTVNEKNATLGEVFKIIKDVSDYNILYKSGDLNIDKVVNVDVKDVSVEELLAVVLAGENVEYIIQNNQIIIKRILPSIRSDIQDDMFSVTGKVIDKEGLPIPGVSISVKGTTIGTITNSNGNYSLNVPEEDVILVFSFIGMQSQEIEINGRSEINVTMEEDAVGLEEVVVVGYGAQKRESVVGAISTIDPQGLSVSNASVSTALVGNLSGIVGVTRSGEPGKNSAAEFYIRGISSFTGNNNPLVLVDGIERDLDLVDTEDIKSFSILKDASASAVYGVRGANGVILITTKRGTEGKPKIDLRAESGITSPTVMPDLVNSAQFASMYNEASGANYYSEEDIEKYRNGSDPDLFPSVDWIDELYRDFASNQRVNVNVSGGSNIAKYYVSGSFYNESSIFKDAGDRYDYNSSINYKRYNFRANMDFSLTKTTNLNVNLSNIYEQSFGPGQSTGGIWGYTFATSPNAFPKEYSDGTISAPSTSSGYNPWNLLVHSGYREQFWNSAQSLIGLKQDLKGITPGLNAEIKFSWDAYTSSLQVRNKEPKQFHATGRDEDGNLIFGNPIYEGSETLGYERSSTGSRTTYLEGSINYSRLFNDVHRIGGLFLYNHEIYNNTHAGNQETSLPYKHQGIAARVTYGYNDTYFAEFNMGYNGSENFAPGHRFGFFPAGAAGWLISNESWFAGIKNTINKLKVKASYGKVGNDNIGGGRRWIYEPTIVGGNSWNYGETGNIGGGSIRIGDVANPNVSWEEVDKTNIGIELGLLNVLDLQVDYFYEKRSGIFIRRAGLPAIVGVSNIPFVNIGKAENNGIDASLEYRQEIGEVILTGKGTFTYTNNKLLDNDEPDWEYKYQNQIGKNIGQPFGLVALGLFESEEQIENSPKQMFGQYRVGDIQYQDINGDGVVDSYDRIAIGYPSIPKVVYGIGGNLQWKSIDVNVFFQGVGQTSFFVGGAAMHPFSSNNLERSSFHEELYYESWKTSNTAEENENAKYPRLSIGGGPGSSNNSQNSTFNQRDGSFIRLKNVEIGYTFPKRILDKTFLSSGRIYLKGHNLYTFSSFDLWDPEKGGGDGSGYPPNRVISLGFSTNF